MVSAPDLILGVASAADSVKQREALARLERISGQSVAATDQGPASPERLNEWLTEVRSSITAAAQQKQPTELSLAASTKATPDKKSEVYTQFEAVLLQNMVEAMMPTDSQAMFGSGTAGSIWKSMLAEKVAEEIARSGTIGIAKQIAAAEAAIQSATPARSEGNEV